MRVAYTFIPADGCPVVYLTNSQKKKKDVSDINVGQIPAAQVYRFQKPIKLVYRL